MRARLGEKGDGKGRRIYPKRIFRCRRNFHGYAVAPLKKFLTLQTGCTGKGRCSFVLPISCNNFPLYNEGGG